MAAEGRRSAVAADKGVHGHQRGRGCAHAAREVHGCVAGGDHEVRGHAGVVAKPDKHQMPLVDPAGRGALLARQCEDELP